MKPSPIRPPGINPHFGFWLCVSLVALNGVLCVFTPTHELKIQAGISALLCSIGAVLFFAQTESGPPGP